MAKRRFTRASGNDRHPLRQVAGFLLAAASIYCLLCLMSYHPLDPSLNRSTPDQIVNMGGYSGALLADVFLQTFGIASGFATLIGLTWGWKMMIGRKISHLWMRLSVLMLALIAWAALLSTIDPLLSWPINSGYGGTVGALLNDAAPGMFTNILFVAFLIGAALVTSAIAFGMSVEEWRAIGRFIRHGSLIAYALGASIAYRVRLRREQAETEEEEYYEEEEYDDEDGEEEHTPWHQRVRERLTFWRREDEDDADEEVGEEEEEEYEVEEYEVSEEDAPPARPRKAKAKAKPARSAQPALALPHGDYELPALTLLNPGPRRKSAGMNQAALQQNMRLLEKVLQDFGVNGSILLANPGPVVTLYELEPAAGTKSSRVIGIADDVARSMSSVSARIAVVPGRNVLGIELPNAQRETVYFREMLESEDFSTAELRLPLALGKDIGGSPVMVDLARMPHLLVAGTTGSGKSVAINTMILSLLYSLTPDECKFIMIDPKMLELSVYDGIPHLLTPVVTEPGKAVVALKWTVREMENRYRLMANLGVRNIDGYNKQIREAKAKGKELTRRVQTGFDPDTGQPIIEEVPLDMAELPFIVVIVDEMADLMLTSGKDIETSIQRLAQMARAAGIHIIMATQRPSVDVITGVIKANFPTRISFQVTSRIDSRTILGEQGAEALLGQGDMLYMAGGGRITRVHGPFVSDKEVEQVVAHLKLQGEPTYIEEVTRDEEEAGSLAMDDGEKDELYDQAVAIVARDRKASTSYVQRCLKIGYNRAASIIDKMERDGVVSAANHVGKREVLVDED